MLCALLCTFLGHCVRADTNPSLTVFWVQDKVILTIAIIPMAEEFGWSSSVSRLIQSAFFYGFMLMQLPGGYLCSQLGGQRVLPAGLALWSAATAAVPFVAHSLPALLTSR